jgi:hypothetical protein
MLPINLGIPRLLDHRGVEFMYHCNRKKINNMLVMLEPGELGDMAANGPFPVQIPFGTGTDTKKNISLFSSKRCQVFSFTFFNYAE